MTIIKSLIASGAIVLGLLSSSVAQYYKHTIWDARQLKVGDSVDEFIPPLRMCVAPGDPKFAEANRKHRETTNTLRQQYPQSHFTDYQLPSCEVIGKASDTSAIITVRSIDAQARICFRISGGMDTRTPGSFDLDAELEALPLYCALVSASTSAKIWSRKDDNK